MLQSVFVVALIFTAQIDGQYSGIDSCDHPSGDPARCIAESQCQEAKILRGLGFKPTSCEGREGDVVCCKESKASLPQTLDLSKEGKTDGGRVDSAYITGPNSNFGSPAKAKNPGWRDVPVENSVTACARYKSFAPSVEVSSPIRLSFEQPTEEEETRKRICRRKTVPLIINGEVAHPKEFPHMALLGYLVANGIQWKCGGSLISEYFVLTAAHCFSSESGNPEVVRLGEHSIISPDSQAHQDYAIANVIAHSRFVHKQFYDDIALLRLKKKVDFSDYIRPACLPPKNFTVSSAIATGWGLTSAVDFDSKSDVLRKVLLNHKPIDLCRKEYRVESKTRMLYRGIDESSQMCFGGEGGKDSAQGDSGGPLQVATDDNCNYFILGVTSFGKTFDNKTSFGVYTRVQHYLDWIESLVWPDLRTIPIVFY